VIARLQGDEGYRLSNWVSDFSGWHLDGGFERRRNGNNGGLRFALPADLLKNRPIRLQHDQAIGMGEGKSGLVLRVGHGGGRLLLPPAVPERAFWGLRDAIRIAVFAAINA
jgi:hypothetical protein